MAPADLVESNFAYTAVINSIFDERPEITNVILTKTDMNVNTQGVTGNTPLMWAIVFGKKSAAKILLKAGADCSFVNEKGETAYALAFQKGLMDVVQLLRSKGCKN